MTTTADHIDRMSEINGWLGRSDKILYNQVIAYISGAQDLQSTIQNLTTPINAAYSSADSGQALRKAEETAAHQRQFRSAEDAEKQWGQPLPESALPAEQKDAPSTENQLWDLWYSILHAARRTSWRDDATHGKLLELVRALKQQPDPPPPDTMTQALAQNWVWLADSLWGSLTLLGPALRETWNARPNLDGKAADVDAEVHAWTNMNAFVARLVGAELLSAWIYAIWAMRDALEDDVQEQPKGPSAAAQLDARVPAATAWVLVLQRKLYDREEDLTPEKPNQGNPGRPGALLKERTSKAEFSKERWRFWKERFEAMKDRRDLRQETRDAAAQAFDAMNSIEGET